MLYILLISQTVPLEVEMAETPANLFFLNAGFLDPSRSEGIVGADMNPAVMYFAKGKLDLYVGASTSSSQNASLHLDLPISAGDTTLGTLPLDFDGSFRDAGGFDAVGVAYKVGRFSVGFLWWRPSVFRIGSPGEVELPMDFIADSLTSFDYLLETDYGDTIPLSITLSGEAHITTTLSAEALMRQGPTFFGASAGWGPFALGLGVKIRRYEGKLSARATLRLDSARLSGDPRAEGWNTDSLEVTYQPDPDSLPRDMLSTSFTGQVSGTQVGLLGGLVVQPVKFLSVALGGEVGLGGEAATLFARGIWLPDTVAGELSLVDTPNVDPVDSTISGKLGLVGGTVRMAQYDTAYDPSSLNLLRYYAIRGGIRLLFINLGGGLELATPGNGVYMGTNYITPSIGIPLPKSELRLGGVFAWRYLQVGSVYIPSVPILYAGVGLTVKPDLSMGPLILREVGFGVRSNPVPWTLSSLTGSLGGEDVSLGDFWPNTSFSLGLRLGMGE